MSERQKVACFFTGGFTEVNAMKLFLRKINSNIDFIQLCPTGTRRSKSDIQNRHIDNIDTNHSGLTGGALIEHILAFIQQKKFQEEEYRAILIEDDKDDRFLDIQETGDAKCNKDAWKKFKKEICDKIHTLYPDIKIIFILAAPEVEAWFLADFEHSFGEAYKRILNNSKDNEYLKVQMRKYFNENILTQRYEKCIEEYGYFNGVYRKLSEEIQKALSLEDFFEERENYPIISYSKRKHGEVMLQQIEPDKVLNKCSVYFREGCIELAELDI